MTDLSLLLTRRSNSTDRSLIRTLLLWYRYPRYTLASWFNRGLPPKALYLLSFKSLRVLVTLFSSSFLLLIAFKQVGASATSQCVFVRLLNVNLILGVLGVLVGKLGIYLQLFLSFWILLLSEQLISMDPL